MGTEISLVDKDLPYSIQWKGRDTESITESIYWHSRFLTILIDDFGWAFEQWVQKKKVTKDILTTQEYFERI